MEEIEFDGEESLNIGESEELDKQNIYLNKTIKVEKEQFSIFEFHRRYKKEQVKLDPDFQRKDRWNEKQKCELIESILMGLPLPYFYFSEDREGKKIAIDGKQRLTAIFEFLENRFKLNNLQILNNLNGLAFDNLEPRLKTIFEDYQLVAQVIKPPTSDRVKFDIFDRVNRGGTQLNKQEMRNALYQGKSTKLLNELSEFEYFKKATAYSINSNTMKDRYLILRFLAFYLLNSDKKLDYQSDVEKFLGETMELLNKLNDSEINYLREIFEISMKNAFEIVGEDVFRLPTENNRKNSVNMYIFEVLAYLFAHIESISDNSIVRDIYQKILHNSDFIDSVTGSNRNSSIKIDKKFKIIKDELEKIK